jgi:uncharacterized membrane protein
MPADSINAALLGASEPIRISGGKIMKILKSINMTLMINTTGVRFLKRHSNRGYTKTAKDTPEAPAPQLG